MRRLATLLACGAIALLASCGGDDEAGDDATSAPPTPTGATTTTAPPEPPLPPIEGVLRLRAVLAPLPVDGMSLNPMGGDDPDTTVIAPENATGLAYELGPSVLDESAVVQATSGLVEGQWSVTILLSPVGSAAADDLAGRCVEQDPTCPRGQVAFTVDGFVVSAPVISQPVLGPELVISGSFSEAEAEALAAALGGAA